MPGAGRNGLAGCWPTLVTVMAGSVFVLTQIWPNFDKRDPHLVLYDSTSGPHGSHILALTKSVVMGLGHWMDLAMQGASMVGVVRDCGRTQQQHTIWTFQARLHV
jgi:hypothetical protein